MNEFINNTNSNAICVIMNDNQIYFKSPSNMELGKTYSLMELNESKSRNTKNNITEYIVNKAVNFDLLTYAEFNDFTEINYIDNSSIYEETYEKAYKNDTRSNVTIDANIPTPNSYAYSYQPNKITNLGTYANANMPYWKGGMDGKAFCWAIYVFITWDWYSGAAEILEYGDPSEMWFIEDLINHAKATVKPSLTWYNGLTESVK